MEREDSDYLLAHGTKPSSFKPRISRKPVPFAGSNNSYRMISLDTNGNDHDASSYSKSDFPKTSTHTATSSTSATSRRPQVPKSRFNPMQNWWLYEILAAAISVSAMTALLGVLYGYNGRVVQRLPLGITLNGIVAVLATISRTALMIPVASCLSQAKWIWFSARRGPNGKPLRDLETFDTASRGSWGSLQLLWMLKARHIACFGALITILTLGFDAFAQQVVSTQYKSTLVSASSLQFPLDVARSENYTISTDADNESYRIPDWPTYAAIYNGILAQNMSFLSVPCTTGNCTWPVIPSLGICGSCSPLTWTTSGNCPPGTGKNDAYGSVCNYTLPDKTSISIGNGDPVKMFQVNETRGTVYNASSKTVPYILNFEAIGMPFGSRFWNDSLVSAQECALWYCIQAYNISVTSNVLNQTIIDTWSTIAPPPPGGMNGGYDFTFTNIPPQMNIRPNSSYFVNILSMAAANNGLLPVVLGFIEAGAEGIEYSNQFIEAIWAGWDNMEQLVSNLGRSMTNNIRQTSPANPYPMYAGTAFNEVLTVYVRWEWLSLPVLLVLSSVLFMISSMLQTRSTEVNAWKSSALALLFSDVDRTLREKSHHGVDRPNGLKKIAGKSRVVLRESSGFLEFKECTPTF